MFRTTHLLVGLLVIGLLCLSGCEKTSTSVNTPLGAEEPNGQVLELFGGQPGWIPIAVRTRVEAFRIDPIMKGESEPEEGEEKELLFAGYPILSGPINVDKKMADALALILADSDTYAWDVAKACEFEPGVGIRFVGVDSSTEILLCFSCDELQIVRDGKRVGHEDTDSARGHLIKIVQNIFPDDKIIQGLKE